mgnify:CR=1 FL=1
MLLVVLGPTASGKSELAFELARRRGADVLSVDSMQVYRGMDIGTAKPSAAERSAVRHHLVDVVDPIEEFTVARFVELADEVIARTGGRLIACGGTPLYYMNLFYGMFAGPGRDAGLRRRLEALGPEELYGRLCRADPAAAARIHRNDTRRLVRALEVLELTGRPISSLQTDWKGKARHEAVWVGLRWEREALNRRINARVRAMFEAGWVDEVRGLLSKWGGLSRTAAEATGYGQIMEHLAGRAALDDTVESIKIATRQLARRQMKWMRRFSQVHWIDAAAPLDEKVRRVEALWTAGRDPVSSNRSGENA